jgi:PAS domain S-box-containing protein
MSIVAMPTSFVVPIEAYPWPGEAERRTTMFRAASAGLPLRTAATIDAGVAERVQEMPPAWPADPAALVDAQYLICVLDRDGRILHFNGACEDATGYSSEQVVGRDARLFVIPPEEIDAFGAVLAEVWETRRSNPQLGHWRTCDGRRRLIAWANQPLLDDDGNVTQLWTAGLDLTERGPASAELERLNLELEQRLDEVSALLAEQSALRRVATLVATGARPEVVLQLVAEEAGRLLGARSAATVRYGDGAAVTVGRWAEKDAGGFPVGTAVPLEGDGVTALVWRTGAPARVADYASRQGNAARMMRELGYRSAVAAPITVARRTWGALIVASESAEPFDATAERRLADFAELVALAVAGTDARQKLVESRARIVEAGDAERRRLERNLHDGAQQRLVSALLTVQLAKRQLDTDPTAAGATLDRAATELSGAEQELRELARGLHPAVLNDRGLAAALGLVAERAPIAVHLDVPEGRLPEPIETAAYFLACEALTNVAKYAQASRAAVELTVEGDLVRVTIADDGIGGADPSRGTGLRGLADRVEAVGGRLDVDSAPGRGTRISAEFPLSRDA